MKVFNHITDKKIPKELLEALGSYRNARKFQAEDWIKAKSFFLNDYMSSSKLNTVVVAISGGVDSAVVLALVNYASKIKNSPIQKIVPINLPAIDNVGATGQNETYQKAFELCKKFGLELLSIDISPLQKQIISLAEKQLNLKADGWANGQTVAYARTPVLYGMTSILSANGFASIIGGTTNRDEGAYLGYVGKASDGMVDVQLISDLHKSEVYKVAQNLDVPKTIINSVCTGDMYDGRIDEDLFGASYDFVELYLWYLNLDCNEQKRFKNSLSLESLNSFDLYSGNLEKLHLYNSHKYLAGSPAVHLDILQSNVKGGWQIQKNSWLEQLPLEPDSKRLNNLFNISFEQKLTKELFTQNNSNFFNHDIGISQVKTIDNFFSEEFIDFLLQEINQQSLDCINESGGKNYISSSYQNKSKRMNIYNISFSELIWHKVKNFLSPIEIMTDYSYCETKGHQYWKPVGINPYIKINQYSEGGLLVPHYDGAYEHSPKHKNMKTVILYLENNDAMTRIIHDHQEKVPSSKRNYFDWTKEKSVMFTDVLFSQKSEKNKVIIFDNKLLHDSTELTTGLKTILLTEIVYEKIGRL